MEHADSQGAALPRALRATGEWAEVVDHADLAGRPRTTVAVRGRGADLTAPEAAGSGHTVRPGAPGAQTRPRMKISRAMMSSTPTIVQIRLEPRMGVTPLVSGPCGRSPARDDTRGGGAR